MAVKLKKHGTNIHLTDSKNSRFVDFALYGKAEQNGEPTPDNPQEITVAGASGSVEVVTENEDSTQRTTANIPTPNGLCGIKVSSGGNYTDENGQQWLCDEVVKYADGSGKRIQRIAKAVFDGSEDEEWSDRTSEYTEKIGNQRRYSTVDIEEYRLIQNVPCISNIGYVGTLTGKTIYSDNGISLYWLPNSTVSIMYVTLENETITDLSTFKSWLASNPITGYYELATPIITDLSAEEIAEIEKLYTFYPVTNISNDAECGMAVTYVSTLLEFLTPKTDWSSSSRFNIEDYNRIRNNLNYLHDVALVRIGAFEIEDMGVDLVVDMDEEKNWDVDVFNAIENNLHTISNKIINANIGTKKTFYENGLMPDFAELNRIESVSLRNKNALDNLSAGLRRIPFKLGQFKARL